MGEVSVVVVDLVGGPKLVLDGPNETGVFLWVLHRLDRYGPFSVHPPILCEEREFPAGRCAQRLWFSQVRHSPHSATLCSAILFA